MLLLPKEERVRVNFSIKVAREKNFYRASRTQVFVGEVWEALPLRKRVLSDIVGQLVDTCTASFEKSIGLGITSTRLDLFVFFSDFTRGLSNVVVFLGSVYFTEEAD